MKFRSLLTMAALASALTFQAVYAQEMMSIHEMSSYLHSDVYRQIERQIDSGIIEELPIVLNNLKSMERDLILQDYPSASSLNLVVQVINGLAAEGQNELSAAEIKTVLRILTRNGVIMLTPEITGIIDPLLAQLDHVSIGEVKTGFLKRQSSRALVFYGKDGKDIQLQIPKDLTAGLEQQYADLDYALVIENESEFTLRSINEEEGKDIVKTLSAAQSGSQIQVASSLKESWQGLKYHLQPGLVENSARYFSSNPENALSVESDGIYLKVNLAKLMDQTGGSSRLSSFIPDTLNARIYPEKILSLTGIRDYSTRERLSPMVIMIKPTKVLPQLLFSIAQ